MEFILKYFPEYLNNERVQKEILKEFAYSICEVKTKLVVNILIRNGIYSLETLYKTPMEDIKRFKNIGETRIHLIQKMKHEISKIIASKEFEPVIHKGELMARKSKMEHAEHSIKPDLESPGNPLL